MTSTLYTQIEKSIDRDTVLSFFEKQYPSYNTNILKDIEKSIFQYILDNTIIHNNISTTINIFVKKYNYYIAEVYNTLPSIIGKIEKKEIQISDILLNPIKVYPENWEFVMKRKEQEEKILTKELVSNSAVSKCYKCNEKNVYTQSIQTRGSDEPATIFYSCLTCGNKWRS